MINKNLFIQNIKDCTTVLQQLRICIDEVKEVIDVVNSIKNYTIMLGGAPQKVLMTIDFVSTEQISYTTIAQFLEGYLLKLPTGYYTATGMYRNVNTTETGIIQRMYVRNNSHITLDGYYYDSSNNLRTFQSPEITLSNYLNYFGSPINISITSY